MSRFRPLRPEDKGRLAEKVMEWGNLVFAGLVVGQFVPGTEQLRYSMIAFGVIAILGAYLLALWMMKRQRGGEVE